ncbi:MAG: DUF748 domain-containing protein [Candidatus Brocadia sp.]|nr:DUF748 domain-containing protein [Candidatus Brocadia sp.]
MSQVKSFFRVGRNFTSWSWPARIVIIGSFLVALYAVVGFLVLPPLVKTRLIKKLSAYTGRNVELGELRMNPFALSTTLRRFTLHERNGERFVSFDELYLNFQTSSIFRWAYTFSKVQLIASYSNIKRLKDGTFNFHDLLPPAREKSETQQKAPVPLLIHHLVVNRAQIVFEDHTRPTPFKEQIAALSFSLRNFTTRPNREGLYEFEAATEQGATLKYRGNLSMVPMHSKGGLELKGIKLRKLWSYLQDQLHFEIAGGELDISGTYAFDITEGKPELRLQDSSVSVRSLSILSKEDGEEAITLPHLSFSGTELDYQKHEMKIALIQSDSAKIRGMLDKDGKFSLQKMFQPKTTVGSQQAHPKSQPKSGGWQINISKIEIVDYALHMKDQTTIPVAQLDLSPVNLKIEDVKIGAPGAAHVELQAGLNQAGTMKVTGKVSPDPLTADLDVQISKVALPPFDSYVKKYTQLEINDGALSLNGHLNFSRPDAEQQIDFGGDIWIESARVLDSVFSEDFVRWERLDLRQVKYDNNPAFLSIHEITARGLYTRIIIGPDRTANVQHILRKEKNPLAETKRQEANGSQLPIHIDQVNIIDSSMNFADLSLRPNFITTIQDLNGTVKGLSSEQLARADIDLKGQVDKYAPVVIQGKINPLSEQAYTDITMNFYGIELTTFSPYSGKFAGYKIEKGKLSLELQYKLSQKILIGENHIVMDQFTLGEKIESPDATTLPVRLAVAILKDSRGVIDLNLPVRGDLNDPQFRLVPLIIKAFVNLIAKAATSPFKMLGALVGVEGEELDFVLFAPGSHALSQEQQSKLGKIARALRERPQLILNLRGTAAESVDHYALAERAILTRIRTQRDIPIESPLAEDEQKRLLKLYREMFKKEDPYDLIPPTDKTGAKIPKDVRRTAVVDAARKKLIEKYPISESDLRTLAQERAAAIKDYMIQQGGLAEPRIFLLEVDTKASATDHEVKMPLALDAR